MEPINAAQEALEPSDSAQCIHHCFERIARMRPEACALISADGVLSYDELNRRANRLARRLQQCGVKQGDLVGVCLPRDSQLPAALLAVMKAGGAYVPLDADHPAERLRLILENTALTHIISVAALQRHLPLDVAHRLVLADAYCNDIAAEADDNLALPPIAESLVYCLFTSGSTGRPKGVAVQHDNLMTTLRALNDELRLHEHSNFLASTTFGFDISAAELFGVWLSGGCVTLVTRDEVLELPALARRIEECAVTIMQGSRVIRNPRNLQA